MTPCSHRSRQSDRRVTMTGKSIPNSHDGENQFRIIPPSEQHHSERKSASWPGRNACGDYSFFRVPFAQTVNGISAQSKFISSPQHTFQLAVGLLCRTTPIPLLGQHDINRTSFATVMPWGHAVGYAGEASTSRIHCQRCKHAQMCEHRSHKSLKFRVNLARKQRRRTMSRKTHGTTYVYIYLNMGANILERRLSSSQATK